MVTTVLKIVLLSAGIYGLIVLVVFVFQNRLMFFPSGPAFGNCPAAEHTGMEAVREGITRYYVRRASPSSPWIVVFHGNAGCACDRLYFIELLRSLDANIALFEYPGYGGDSRKPGQAIILDDARKLMHHIREKTPENTRLFLLGESLGTGVAVWLAKEVPVAGLILVSPYTSIVDVAAAHYFWLPVRRLLKNRFPAERWAEKVVAPVIAFHGKEDRIIPVTFARRQIKNFPGRADLFEIDDAGHNDITVTAGRFIQAEVKRFIN